VSPSRMTAITNTAMKQTKNQAGRRASFRCLVMGVLSSHYCAAGFRGRSAGLDFDPIGGQEAVHCAGEGLSLEAPGLWLVSNTNGA
jgi:hypothetical protein